MRRRYLQLQRQLKETEEDPLEDLEDPDEIINGFAQFEGSHQALLQVPEDLNFEDYIIKPEVFKLLDEQKDKNCQKEKQDHQPMMDNFMKNESQNTQLKKPRKEVLEDED